jgi:phosphoribosylformylglycinamidine synthase
LYCREIMGWEAIGPAPPVDLAAERKNGDFVRAMIEAGHVAACHDVSDGGLLVAVAEMAMAGGRGLVLDPVPTGLSRHAWLFGEDQARYLVETANPDLLLESARNMGIYAQRVGIVSEAALTLPGGNAISVAELKAANEAWLPGYMGPN